MSNIKNYFPYSAIVHDLEKQPKQKMADGMFFQHFHTHSLTFVRWEFEKGVIIPEHHHPNEQITWFPKGSAKVMIDGKEHFVAEGQILFIPPNTSHEFHILEDSIDIDIFSPVRQDWIDNKVNFYVDPHK